MWLFDWPSMLLLLPLPWLVWRLAVRGQPRAADLGQAIVHPYSELIAELTASDHRRQVPWLWLIGCCGLLLALAKPQWPLATTSDRQSGRDIVLAMDISGSMRAMDFVVNNSRVNRLDMLKAIVRQFIEARPGDRISLIVFGDDAFTLTPLTRDKRILYSLLDETKNGIIGEKTALGDAIALGVKRLADSKPDSGVIVLLTDGTNTSGQLAPVAAAALAKDNGIRIHTVGIGSHDKVPFPRAALELPEIGEIPLDEVTLRAIATETGGKYFFAGDTARLQEISQQIEKLERVAEFGGDGATVDLFWLPLLAGMLLLAGHYWRDNQVIAP